MGAKTSTVATNGEGGGGAAARERTFSVGGGGGGGTTTASTEMGGSGFSILRGLASAAAGAHSATTHQHHGSERPRSFSSSGGVGVGGVGGGGSGRDGGGGEPTFESLDTDSSSTEDSPQAVNYPGTIYTAHSLPPHIFSWNGIKCPVCSKFVLPDDIECHLVMCLTKPRLTYNEDVLTEDKGECVICLEEMSQGDTIARLPCLCIYHKSCIDKWFDKNRSCPEHPSD